MKLYDFFISKFDIEKTISPEIEIDFAISKFQTQVLIDNHARNLKQFHNQNGIKVVLNFKNRPNFSGFDPMHAEAINDSLILHSTLLKLVGANNNELFITGWPVVTYYSNQIWNVNSVVLFVPENEIEIFENNRIAIKNDNLLINWEGALYNKDKNEIVFDCN